MNIEETLSQSLHSDDYGTANNSFDQKMIENLQDKLTLADINNDRLSQMVTDHHHNIKLSTNKISKLELELKKSKDIIVKMTNDYTVEITIRNK